MDNINTASNDADQQSAASIVASLASATPITSEIVTDAYEPDPKFEITTLEKASYEDIYMESNSPGQINTIQTDENGSNDEGSSQHGEKQSEDSLDGGLSSDQEQRLSERDNPSKVNENPVTKVEGTACDDPTTGQVPSMEQTQADVSSSIDAEPKPDHTLSGQLTDSTPLQLPKTELELDLGVATSEALTEKDQTIQNEQHSAISTSSVEPSHPGDVAERSIDTNILTHTSVDAQMEKVIENIVELGGVHQFSQTLGQDRDKVLESIRREISSDRTSIDLIADVASKQQSLEVGSTDNNKSTLHKDKDAEMSNEAPILQGPPTNSTIHQEKPQTDLNQSLKNSPAKEEFARSASTKSDIGGIIYNKTAQLSNKEAVDRNVEPVVESVETAKIEKQDGPIQKSEITEATVEPIVVESDDLEDRDVGVESKQNVVPGPMTVQDSVSTVEPVESFEEVAAEPVNTEPIVDEAQSSDESNQIDERVASNVEVSDHQPAESLETKPEEPMSTVNKKANVPAEEQLVLETPRRKSGRKPKFIERSPEALPKVKPQKSARRASAKKRVTDVIDEKTNTNVDVEKAVDDGEQCADLGESVPAYNITSGSGNVSEPQESIKLKIHIQKATVTDEHTPELTEPIGRQSRSLRTRTPKRPHEEEDVPSIEPPKKQIRRSRGAGDDQNKSYEAIKNTPSIKLPYKSRQTISVSDPATRQISHRGATTSKQPFPAQNDKKYICHGCGYATDRLNNIANHTKFCPERLKQGEVMKAEITRQQQQAKGRKRR